VDEDEDEDEVEVENDNENEQNLKLCWWPVASLARQRLFSWRRSPAPFRATSRCDG